MFPDPKHLVVSFVLLFVFGSAAAAESDKPAQVGVSAAVRGDVSLSRATANTDHRRLASGDPIFVGDVVRTRDRSGVQILLLNETVLTVGPGSEIRIVAFRYESVPCREWKTIRWVIPRDIRRLSETPPQKTTKRTVVEAAEQPYEHVTKVCARREPPGPSAATIRVVRGQLRASWSSFQPKGDDWLVLHLPTMRVDVLNGYVFAAAELNENIRDDDRYGCLKSAPERSAAEKDILILKGWKKVQKSAVFVTPVPPYGAELNVGAAESGSQAETSDEELFLSVTGTGIFGYDGGRIGRPFTVEKCY